jgi:hypothetical protein
MVRRSTMLATASAWLAAALLVAQLGGAAHLALVQHVRCADHDELVELPHAGVARADAASPPHGRALAPAASARHGHDHCAVSALRCQGHACAPRAAARALASSTELAPPAGRAPPPAIALLDLAPKSSPPQG